MLGLLLTAVATLLLAVDVQARSVALALVAAALLGTAYGICILTGLVETQALADPERVAGLTGVYYSLIYVGFVLPAVLSGLSAVAPEAWLLVLVALAMAGSWLLDRFGVPESGSTSLLAVGIMAVLVMVFLLGSLDAWWAAIAIPVTAVVGYTASWWVTHAVVGDDTEAEAAEPYDVR